MAKTSKSARTAQAILDQAAKLGWIVTMREQVLTITKLITAGCNESFAQADMEYSHILGLVPATGSQWGTDGGGMGAVAAMRQGVFTMNKSGVSKRLLTALSKLA